MGLCVGTRVSDGKKVVGTLSSTEDFWGIVHLYIIDENGAAWEVKEVSPAGIEVKK